MQVNLRNHFQSFKDKNILKVFLIDAIFFSIIFYLLIFFKNFIRNNTLPYSAEQFQAMLISAPQQAANLLIQLKSYIASVSIFLFLAIIYLLFSYSLTRKYIWNLLAGKKLNRKDFLFLFLFFLYFALFILLAHLLKNYLVILFLIFLALTIGLFKIASKFKNNFSKWILLNLIILIILPFYLILGVIFRYLIYIVIRNIDNQVIITFIQNLINSIIAIIFIIILFSIYNNFSKHHKLWMAIGDGILLIKKRWKLFLKLFLSILVTLMIFSGIISYSINNFIFDYYARIIIQVVALLLIIAWLKVYFVRTIKD